MPVNEVARILINEVISLPRTWTDAESNVVLGVRLPRVLLGMLVGGGLALGGAALQAAFRNPLVSRRSWASPRAPRSAAYWP